MFGWVFAGGILLVGSIYDIKSYSLPWWLVVLGLLGGVAGGSYFLISGEGDWREVLTGLLPGGLAIGLAFFSKEQIGYGDGLILWMLGGCVGTQSTVGILMIGLFTSFVVSIVLLMVRKAGRDTKIPFVPCLLLGYFVFGLGGLMNAF